MSVNTSAVFLGLLIATSLASGASALEASQTPAPADNKPSFGLPAFLDGARLPDLQEAWRAHFGSAPDTPAAPAVAEPTSTPAPMPEAVSHEEPAASPDPASDAAIESARATITRAEQATDKAANVRARAEDLSRRFGAGDAAAAPPAVEPASAGDDITTGATAAPAPGVGGETAAPGASAETAAPSDGAEVAAPAEVPADQPATAVETTTTATAPAPADVASDDKSKASSLMRAGLSPASVGPSAAAAERKPATPTHSAGTVSPAEAKPASGSDPIPENFRAFGWDSQP